MWSLCLLVSLTRAGSAQYICSSCAAPGVPVHCEWSAWAWSQCSATCGSGVQTGRRSAELNSLPKNPIYNLFTNLIIDIDIGGLWHSTVSSGAGLAAARLETPGAVTSAPARLTASGGSGPSGRVRVATLNRWYFKLLCFVLTVTCGEGREYRTRGYLLKASNGGKDCEGKPYQFGGQVGNSPILTLILLCYVQCSERCCAQDCQWSEWIWEACSASCGGGQRIRRQKSIFEKKIMI